jgi:hypothetical protein
MGWLHRKKTWGEWFDDGFRKGDWSSEKLDTEKIAAVVVGTTATAIAAGKTAEACERMTREEANAIGRQRTGGGD